MPRGENARVTWKKLLFCISTGRPLLAEQPLNPKNPTALYRAFDRWRKQRERDRAGCVEAVKRKIVTLLAGEPASLCRRVCKVRCG
jgi:hypothetical protein